MGVKLSVEDTRFGSGGGKGKTSVEVDKDNPIGTEPCIELAPICAEGIDGFLATAVHAKLKAQTKFTDWFYRKNEKLKAVYGRDFIKIPPSGKQDSDQNAQKGVFPSSGKNLGGRPPLEYAVSKAYAIKLAASENTEAGLKCLDELAKTVVKTVEIDGDGVFPQSRENLKTDVPQIFTFEDNPVRVIIRDGEPWWALSDVCHVLGILNPRDVANRLDSNQKSTVDLNYGGNGSHQNTIINESGLYAVIFRSDKPKAKRFQKWVFGEVLPQIRKTGSYTGTRQPALTREQKVAEALLISQEMLAEAKQQIAQLEAKTEEFKFKVTQIFAPHLEMVRLLSKPNSAFLLSGRECAKFLDLGFGNVKLYHDYLRPWGWLCKDSNEPTQYAIDRGWLTTAFSVSKTPDKHGELHGNIAPKFTYHGVLAVLRRMVKEGVTEYSDEVKVKENTLLKCLKEGVALYLPRNGDEEECIQDKAAILPT